MSMSYSRSASSSTSSSCASSSSSTAYSTAQPLLYPHWLPSQPIYPRGPSSAQTAAKNPALAGLKLDCLRASLSATRIVARDTNDCLYSITVNANACSPTTTGLHRGSILDSQYRRSTPSPFAMFKGKSVYMNNGGGEQANASSVTKVKKRDFLYSSGFFKQADRFRVNDIEYKLHKIARSQDVDLVISNDTTKTPLCRFKAEDEYGERSSTIDILPRAISSDQAPRTYALLHNGRPTPLLDAALIAEKIYRANSRRKSNEPSVDAEDDYSSDLNGEA